MGVSRQYMLDTNVFNHLLDGKISTKLFLSHRLLITGVQLDELKKTSDPKRQEDLLSVVALLNPETILCSSFALDIEGAGYDQATWNDGSGNFEKMRDCLKVLDIKQKKKDDFLNRERDILIAEAALKNNATLVSADRNLCKIIKDFGGYAMNPSELSTSLLPLS